MSVQGTQITVMLMLTVLILKVVSSVSVEQAMKELVKLAQVNKYVDINFTFLIIIMWFKI